MVQSAKKPDFDLTPTLLDRVVRYFSPEKALNRTLARARDQYATFALGGSWTGASTGRRQTENWATSRADADEDIRWDLEKLRERSRDLMRNNPVAAGINKNMLVHVVGTGLAPRPEIDYDFLGLTEDEARVLEEQLERLFNMWACSTDCDITRENNFYGQQGLAFISAGESGDCLVLMPYKKRPNDIFGLKLQIVEGDRLCNKQFLADSKNLRSGVVIDDDGAPTSYQILRTHPGALTRDPSLFEWDEIPAFGSSTGRRNVIHLFERTRPGQNRGVPLLAPVIEIIKQVGTYTDAEIQRAVISSFFTVFVKTNSGEGLAPGLPTDNPGSGSTDQGKYALGAGAILDLAPGEEVQFADPKSPNNAFDPFVQALFHQIGMALGIPYELLVMHYTASYSASRAAILHAYKFFTLRREWLAAKFCQPIYEAWLDEAVAAGYITAPGYFKDPAVRAAYRGCQWIGDQMGQLNPKDEVDAAAERVELGISDLQQETVAYNGRSWRRVHKNRVTEHAQRAAAGLEPAVLGVPGRASYPPGGSPDASGEGTTSQTTTTQPAPQNGGQK